MLLFLPRLALRAGREAVDESAYLAVGLLDLSVDELEAGDDRGDMGAGGLDGSGGEFSFAFCAP